MRWLLGLVVSSLLIYIAWNVFFPSHIHRYRLTIEVEADGNVHSGSSVIEVAVTEQPKLLPEIGALGKIRGEAVFVDLGQGRNLVALLAGGPHALNEDAPRYVAVKAYGLPPGASSYSAINRLSGQRELTYPTLPTLATFLDVNDPKSGRILHPNELEHAFGAGVRFRHGWVEITTDPPTSGRIKDRLPFLKGMSVYTGGSRKTPGYPALNLSVWNFVRS